MKGRRRDRRHGVRHGRTNQIVRLALWRYAEIAGWVSAAPGVAGDLQRMCG